MWFVNISECESILREEVLNIIELDHVHVNEVPMLNDTYFIWHLIHLVNDKMKNPITFLNTLKHNEGHQNSDGH